MRDVEYRTTIEDKHWREEEFQWARILAQGDSARGMVLLYLQKACTAFHEFEPAFQAGALDNSRLDQTYNTPALTTIFLAAQQVEWITGNGGLDTMIIRTGKQMRDAYLTGGKDSSLIRWNTARVVCDGRVVEVVTESPW